MRIGTSHAGSVFPFKYLLQVFFLLGLLQILSGFLWSGAVAQEYLAKVENYGLPQGLSHQCIYDIHIDEEGFLWLATRYGLNRFDGNNFTWWTKEKDGLVSNRIYSILPCGDRELMVLFVTNWNFKHDIFGVSFVSTTTGEVRSLRDKLGTDLPFDDEFIFTILPDEKGGLLISASKGAGKGYQIHHWVPELGFQKPLFESEQLISLKKVTSSGMLWFSLVKTGLEEDQLFSMDLSGRVHHSICIDKEPSHIKVLSPLPNGPLLFLNTLSEPHSKFYHLSPAGSLVLWENPNFTQALLDIHPYWDQLVFINPETGNFWFKGDTVLRVIHPKKGKIYNFVEEFPEVVFSRVHVIKKGANGLIWVGTETGLHKITLVPDRFKRLLYSSAARTTPFQGYSCRGITKKGKRLFVNTYNGRMEIDLASQQLKVLPEIRAPYSVPEQTYTGIYPLAIGLRANGNPIWGDFVVIEKNDSTEKENLYTWDDALGFRPNIWSFYEEENGRLWVGSATGLGYLDSAGGTIQLAHQLNKDANIERRAIYLILPSKEGFLWLSTARGLVAFDPQK
ncbi:MAG: two-component regulator propeller domain-containing protein, partial [Bacteroidota bacterium]